MKKALIRCGDNCCVAANPAAHLKKEKNVDYQKGIPILGLIDSLTSDNGSFERVADAVRAASVDVNELTIMVCETCPHVGAHIYERMPEILTKVDNALPDFKISGVLLRPTECGSILVHFHPKHP
jgi:hypothetical protein